MNVHDLSTLHDYNHRADERILKAASGVKPSECL
jgi:hypothetical protein